MYKDGDDCRLAPAYDMVSTKLLMSEKDDPEEMALMLNGRKRKLTRDDFFTFGKTIGLSEKQIANAVKRIIKHMPTAVNVVERSFLSLDKQAQFLELLASRAGRLVL